MFRGLVVADLKVLLYLIVMTVLVPTVLIFEIVFLLSLANVLCYMAFPDAIEGHEVTVSELIFDPFCD
jgi:hypothetical protein